MQDVINEAETLYNLMMNLDFNPQKLFEEWSRTYGLTHELSPNTRNFSPMRDTSFLLRAMDDNISKMQ